jgi:hypothetical protein
MEVVLGVHALGLVALAVVGVWAAFVVPAEDASR